MMPRPIPTSTRAPPKAILVSSPDLLVQLSQFRDWDSFRKILPRANKTQLTYKTAEKCTVLFMAVAASCPIDIIKLLLGKGLDVNEVKQNGCSCLCVALEAKSDLEVIKLLLSAGATLQCDEIGWTPLHVAAQFDCSLDVIRLLLDHGADINAENTRQSTPLHRAVSRASPALVELLLQRGAKPDGVCLHSTPLHHAVSEGASVANVKLLCEYGADVTLKDLHGYTPLMCAVQAERRYLIPVLSNPPLATKSLVKQLCITAGPSPYTCCEYCQKVSHDGRDFPKCKGCLKVSYCAMECARAHWSVHKKDCVKSKTANGE